jgi:hypothetical protein
MASGPGKLPEADMLRVATVCDLFLDHSQKHHVADTYRWYKDYLQDFCDLYGTLLVQDLKPLHVSRWLDAHPGWKGARRCAVIAIKRAFNWAEGEGLLDANPLRKVKKPPQTFREHVLTREERQEVSAAIRDQAFRDFVFAMAVAQAVGVAIEGAAHRRTTVPVRDETKSNHRYGRLWDYIGDQDHPGIVFDYTTTHARDGPAEFLKDFKGFLQADAYGGRWADRSELSRKFES